MSSSRVNAFIYLENSLHTKDINSLHLPYAYLSYARLCVVFLDANDCVLGCVTAVAPLHTVSLQNHANAAGLPGHIFGV